MIHVDPFRSSSEHREVTEVAATKLKACSARRPWQGITSVGRFREIFCQSSLICTSALRMKLVTAMTVAVTDLSFGHLFSGLLAKGPLESKNLEVEMISMLVLQCHVVQARL